MLEQLEDGDLDVKLSFAFVCNGKQRDFVKLREVIRNFAGVKLIYGTCSAGHLGIAKEKDLSVEQWQRIVGKGKVEVEK
jgi:hypothetical protein